MPTDVPFGTPLTGVLGVDGTTAPSYFQITTRLGICTIAIRSLQTLPARRRDEHPRRVSAHSAALAQNAYVERVIGSIRRGCLDHVIVMNAGRLHRLLTTYVAY